jgi:predicted TIM-barrel fold metal-dependent hydrolase
VSQGQRGSAILGRPIIDAHTHPRLPGEPLMVASPHGPVDYLGLVDGVDVRYIAALVMAPAGDLSRTRELNDKVLTLGSETDGRFYPVCSVHPADGKAALIEVDRVAKAGARALKLHPNTQKFDVGDDRVTCVVRRAATRHLPILFDSYSPFDADQPGKFIKLAMEVPDARLILAHGHGPRFPELLVYEILSRYPWWRRNVWVDLSGTASLLARGPFAKQFTWVCRKVGTDRLLFGSDYPLDQPKAALRALASLGFNDGELTGILYNNAAQLFGLPPAKPTSIVRRRTGRP